MVYEAIEQLLRVVGWAAIPDRLTQFLLPYYFQRFLGTIPAPGTEEYAKAYRRVYASVITAYLSYNLYQAAFNQPPNFYQLLKVGPDADEGQLKTAFRNFARKNHPDKVGPSGEGLFMTVRHAYESLKHPIKRYAYDRFGPDSLQWEHVASYKEYLETGIWRSAGFYLVTGFFMSAYAFLGQTDSGTVWRILLFCYIAFAELMLCVQSPPLQPETTASSIPIPEGRSALTFPLALLRMVFPHWVPYQHVEFLHQIFITLSMAITRIGPVVFREEGNARNGMSLSDERFWTMTLSKLGRSTQIAGAQVNNLIQRELVAMRGAPRYDAQGNFLSPLPLSDERDPAMETLSAEMEQMLIDGHIRSHPMLRVLWDTAVKKTRETMRFSRFPSAVPIPEEDDAATIVASSTSTSPREASFPPAERSHPGSPIRASQAFTSTTPSRRTLSEYLPSALDRPGLRTRRSSNRVGSASPARMGTPSKMVVDPIGSPAPTMRLGGTPQPSWFREDIISSSSSPAASAAIGTAGGRADGE